MPPAHPMQLSYDELERRIAAIPDGPAGVLNTSKLIWRLDVIGTLGIVLGLAPSLLIKILPPQEWMVLMAKVGVVVAALFLAPGFFRNIWLLVLNFMRWKPDFVGQLDHDIIEFRSLSQWLAGFAVADVTAHLRFVQAGQARMTAKLGWLAGGIDKLGVLPLLLALAIQLKSFGNLNAVPTWQLVVALFAAVMYLIGLVGSLMRLRLQLYEMVLSESLAARAATDLGREATESLPARKAREVAESM